MPETSKRTPRAGKERLLTFTEACDTAGRISPNTLASWIRKGWLRPVLDRVETGEKGRPGARFAERDVVALALARRTLVRVGRQLVSLKESRPPS